MNAKILSICTLFIFGILSSCIPADKPVNGSFTATKTMQVSISPSMSFEAESPTPTAKAAVTPSPVLILTSAPTLDADVAFRILRDYLKNKQPCQLPCWWGITPGKSTLSEVQKQLTDFSGISKRIYFGQAGNSWVVGNLDIDFDEGDSVIGVRSSYLASSNIEAISFVGIDTVSLPKSTKGRVYGDVNYNELLFAYTLPQIVSTYGIPAQTFMTAEIYAAEPTAPDYFVIRLLYPNLGVFLRYRMPAETNDSVYMFCPSQSVVYLDLIPQEYGNDYKDYFKQIASTEWNPAIPEITFYKSTDEALGITNEEFYRLIATSPTKCFESPISIWPDP